MIRALAFARYQRARTGSCKIHVISRAKMSFSARDLGRPFLVGMLVVPVITWLFCMSHSLEKSSPTPNSLADTLLLNVCHRYMRVAGTNGTILAVGDASTIEGVKMPTTGQVR